MWWRNLGSCFFSMNAVRQKELLKHSASYRSVFGNIIVRRERWQWFSTHHCVIACQNTESGFHELIMNSASTKEVCLSSPLLAPGLWSWSWLWNIPKIWYLLPLKAAEQHCQNSSNIFISSMRLPTFNLHCRDTIKVSYCSPWII